MNRSFETELLQEILREFEPDLSLELLTEVLYVRSAYGLLILIGSQIR